MDNTYISEKYSIIEALDEIDAFKTRMEKFMKQRPNYSYSISINENTNLRSDKKWVIKLNIKKDAEGYN